MCGGRAKGRVETGCVEKRKGCLGDAFGNYGANDGRLFHVSIMDTKGF